MCLNPAIWFAAGNIGFNFLTGDAGALAAGGVGAVFYGLGLGCAGLACVAGTGEAFASKEPPSGKAFHFHTIGSALFGAWNIATGNALAGLGFLLWSRSGRQQALFLDSKRK